MAGDRKSFDYRFQVSFEETNVVGNVYFANYFVWQGKCREAFLALFARQVLDDFARGHGMITKESSCEFINEAFAFDDILICMYLEKLSRTTITMGFDYFRERGTGRTLLARGRQMAIWSSPGEKITMLPEYLYNAIKAFTE